jgi:hypothetical protein
MIAKFISFVMHPLFIMFYVMVLLVLVHPFAFGVQSITEKRAITMLMGIFATAVILPGFGILLLKPLGFMNSYQTPERQERIGPYIILIIMYVWVYKNMSAGFGFPEIAAQIFLGATIAICIAFFINNFIKISAHMNGVGGLVGALLILLVKNYPGGLVQLPLFGQYFSVSLTAILILAVLLAGATGYARLALKAHTYQELVLGFSVGFLGQLIALMINDK